MKENVKGILTTYKTTGKIGTVTPKDNDHAKRIARGIAKSTRARAKATASDSSGLVRGKQCGLPMQPQRKPDSKVSRTWDRLY